MKNQLIAFTLLVTTFLTNSSHLCAQLIRQGEAERLAVIFKAASNFQGDMEGSMRSVLEKQNFHLQKQEFDLFYTFLDRVLISTEGSSAEFSQSDIDCLERRISSDLPELQGNLNGITEQLQVIRTLIHDNTRDPDDWVANTVISNLISPDAHAPAKDLIALLIFNLHINLQLDNPKVDPRLNDALLELNSSLSRSPQLDAIVKLASLYRMSHSKSFDMAALKSRLEELRGIKFWVPFVIPEGNVETSLAITLSTPLQPNCVVYPSERDLFEGYRANTMSSYARNVRAVILQRSIGAATVVLSSTSRGDAASDFRLLRADLDLCCARALQQDSINDQLSALASIRDCMRVAGIENPSFDDEFKQIREKFDDYDVNFYENAVFVHNPPINYWEFTQEVKAIAQTWEKRLLAQFKGSKP